MNPLLYHMAAGRMKKWFVLPTDNFETCFGTAFGRKYLPRLPNEVFEHCDSGYGVGRYLVKPEFLPKI